MKWGFQMFLFKTKLGHLARVFGFISLGFLAIALILLAMAFSVGGWGAIVPLVFAALSGLVFIALGIVALIILAVAIVKNSEAIAAARNETPAQLQSRRRRTIVISASIPVALGLVGLFVFLAPIGKVSQGIEVIDAFKSDAPNTFTVDFEYKDQFRFCFLGDCGTQSTIEFQVDSPAPVTCSAAINWAKNHGLETVQISGYGLIEVKPDDPATKLACLNNNIGLRLVGASNKVPWIMDLMPTASSVTITAGGEYDASYDNPITYQEFVNTTDEATAYYVRLSNTIAAWRVANPNEDPDSLANLNKAVKASSDPNVKKTKFVGSASKVDYGYIQYPNDPSQLFCISVAKYDETYFGFPDPGTGYIPSISTDDAHPQFGQLVNPALCGQKTD